MNNCIFTTHTTLTKEHAKNSLSSLLKNNKEFLVWDNFIIYNTQEEEISNDWLKETILFLDGEKQIKNLVIFPYDKNSQKTLTRDFINQLNFLIKEGFLLDGKTLFLKSDYCLSTNFNSVFNRVDLNNSIWCLPIYNAKSKVSQSEIDELCRDNFFNPLYKGVTYYRGGSNHPITPENELSPNGFLKDTDTEIRFVSHNVQADYNVPVIDNKIIKFCYDVALNTIDLNNTWGGTEPFFKRMFYEFGIKKCPEITAFAVHMYHSIYSINSNRLRGDIRKEQKGEEY